MNGRWVDDNAPNPLTERGRLQAEELGQKWTGTRIDYLVSSPIERAHDTAKALSNHNTGHPEVHINNDLIERKFGRKVARLMAQGLVREAREEMTGLSYFGPRPQALSLIHRPDEAGESFSDLSTRVQRLVSSVLQYLSVKLSGPPEFFLERKNTTDPTDLPDGVPHVVVVSHNHFLVELYETMHSWRKQHRRTSCDYRNAAW
jgi:broad specificity phosphatase PhoE